MEVKECIELLYNLKTLDKKLLDLFEKKIGLSLTRFQIIKYLHESSFCTSKQISQTLEIDAAAITRHIKILENEGYKVVIEGATNAETKTSYAEIGIQFAKQYIADKEKNKHLYVTLCGSGIGISIALNRFKTIICARVTSEEEARLAKLHNNANILCFGGR